MTDLIEKKLSEWERKSKKAIDTIPGSRAENPAKAMLQFIHALRVYRQSYLGITELLKSQGINPSGLPEQRVREILGVGE